MVSTRQHSGIESQCSVESTEPTCSKLSRSLMSLSSLCGSRCSAFQSVRPRSRTHAHTHHRAVAKDTLQRSLWHACTALLSASSGGIALHTSASASRLRSDISYHSPSARSLHATQRKQHLSITDTVPPLPACEVRRIHRVSHPLRHSLRYTDSPIALC